MSAVQARVRRLEAERIVRGYTADVDPDAIGLPLAAIIAITPLDVEHEYDIPERLGSLTEIESCHSVAGEDSFMLFVRVASPDRAGGADPRDPAARQRVHPDDRGAADLLRAAGSPRPRSSGNNPDNRAFAPEFFREYDERMTTATRPYSTPEIAPADVHATVARHMLADGYELVLDLDASHGSELVDARDGTRYLDLFTFFASSALGHEPSRR